MKAKLPFLLSVILMMAIVPVRSSGQDAASPKKAGRLSGGLGFFTPGIHTIQYTRLNNFLPAGYPLITSRPIVTAGAGYAVFSNFVIGGEGGTMHAGSFSKGNQLVDLTGTLGFFSLGYVVLHKKGFMMYPLLSIGSNTFEMYIHQKDGDASFGTVTGEPFQSTTLLYETKMLKLSVTGHYVVAGSKSDNGTGGLMIGLEVGYQMGYKKGVWTYDNGKITDGPNFCNNGLFVQLMIGGGGVGRK
jgi:hypothetical protein